MRHHVIVADALKRVVKNSLPFDEAIDILEVAHIAAQFEEREYVDDWSNESLDTGDIAITDDVDLFDIFAKLLYFNEYKYNFDSLTQLRRLLSVKRVREQPVSKKMYLVNNLVLEIESLVSRYAHAYIIRPREIVQHAKFLSLKFNHKPNSTLQSLAYTAITVPIRGRDITHRQFFYVTKDKNFIIENSRRSIQVSEDSVRRIVNAYVLDRLHARDSFCHVIVDRVTYNCKFVDVESLNRLLEANVQLS